MLSDEASSNRKLNWNVHEAEHAGASPGNHSKDVN